MAQIYLRNNQERRVGMKLEMKLRRNDVSKLNYEILATHIPVVPLDKREGTVYTYINGITVLGPLSGGCMRFRELQQYIHIFPLMSQNIMTTDR